MVAIIITRRQVVKKFVTGEQPGRIPFSLGAILVATPPGFA
jgi:hypothetical protein